MQSDLDIARNTPLRLIPEIAEEMLLTDDDYDLYGSPYIAKLRLKALERLADRPHAPLILVSAITPTPLGEGKTTAAIGLAQAFKHLGKRAVLTLRQPSQGPTFGIKGGAAGGGYAQVAPMDLFNLHLTGDFHAVTAANNLLAAMIDNRLLRGNPLNIDTESITWRRVLDVNDRALRDIIIGMGGRAEGGVLRQTGFDITAASEVMAILALATSLPDLRARLGRIVIGQTMDRQPVTAEMIGAAGAMTALLTEALRPTLMQTLEGTPAIIHAGPFANIAHGNSSVLADQFATRLGDYVITEAGFGADIGAEKFFNIKARVSGIPPAAVVLVATVRALKMHSGRHHVVAGKPLPPALLERNVEDVEIGGVNLCRHIEIIRLHGIQPIVAINRFDTDHADEIAAIERIARDAGAFGVATCTHFRDGGRGAVALAELVAQAAVAPNEFHHLYDLDQPLKAKIETIARNVYGAADVTYEALAEKQIKTYEANGFGGLPICMAKTHLSISHDPALKGSPHGFTFPVREVRASVGAGFIYPICGDMRTMPGLPEHPAAENVDVDADGLVTGLM
ncbi:MAG: formate--tetrahydrofolate ligase [Chloroflexota bacterium]|nr:formate--tetrahydrofolate ligase [Chloroflexota bacterium]